MDITKWLPGEYKEYFSIEIPENFVNGKYKLQIAIGGGNKPFVQFANEMERDEEYFTFGEINISE